MKIVIPSLKLVALYVMLSALTVSFAVLAAGTYTAIQERNSPAWLSYSATPWEVINQPRPGDSVLFEVKRCNSSARGRSYDVSRFMINTSSGMRTILPPGIVSILPGCNTELSAINIVPMGTVPGTYVLEGYAEVDNGHVPVTVYWSTQPFDVVAP